MMVGTGKCVTWLHVPGLGTVARFPPLHEGSDSLVTVSDAVVFAVSRDVPMGQAVSVGRRTWAGLTVAVGMV